jgi:hypothetical protein
MKNKFYHSFLRLLFTIGLVFFFSKTNGQISSWTYEPPQGTITNPTSNTGSGTSSVVNLGGGTITPGSATGMAGTGCGTQNGATAWALNPFDAGTVNESNGTQFNTSTVGYQNINFTWDQRWSNTAPNTIRVQYTTNGTTWTNFNLTGANTTFCSGSINANGCFETDATGDIYRRINVNFSAVTAANNNPNFGVRILASFYQLTTEFRQTSAPTIVAGLTGTWRFDNVAFTGTLIPGPTASVISGTTSICQGNSANIKVTITGGAGPFTVVYTDGTTNFTVNNYISGSNILVSPASTKTYTIVSVTNSNGAIGSGNSGAAVITVNLLPAIPTATNITTCATGVVVMTGGSAPPLGHTGSYSIGSSYSGPTTTFTYTITNTSTGCSRTSATYTFTRNVAPAITSQPTGTQTVCQGTAFSPVSVTATGSATLTYQWFRNTTNSTTGGIALTGAPFAAEIANGSKTATFTPLSTTVGTYYYYVTITNTCSSVKSGILGVTAAGPYTVLPPAVGGTASNDQTISCGISAADLTVTGYTNTVTKWQYATDFAFTTPIDIASSASATLLSAQIGVIPTTRYYRAVIENAICSAYSNVVTLTLGSSTTWNGSSWSNGTPTNTTPVVFNGNYSSTGDLDACSVSVVSGTIVFNSGHSLIVQNEVIVSGGTLTFENNASLVQVNNTTNSGNITYKRYSTPVRKYDFTYWSSPVIPQTLVGFSPLTLSDKYFIFNQTINNWQSVPSSSLMDAGKGYIIRAPQSFDPVLSTIFNGQFYGIPNNGDIYTDIVVGLGTINLLGNPYPSAIDADLFLSDAFNDSKIEGAIYLWTHNTPIASNNYVFNDYAIYTYTGGIGTTAAPNIGTGNNSTPTGKIAAGQGFMIEGSIPSSTNQVVFKNSMRLTGTNSQFYRNGSENRNSNEGTNTIEKHRFWIEVISEDATAYKQILIGYIQNATNGIDKGYDAKVFDIGNQVFLYTKVDETILGIQGKALPFQENDVVPLGFKSTVNGNYKIRLSDFDGLFENQTIYIEDTYSNSIHNLKESDYSFSTISGTFEDRFKIRYTNPNLLTTNQQEFNDNSILTYQQYQELIINSMLTEIKEIALTDVSGRLIIKKENCNSSIVNIGIEGISKDIYIVKIKLINDQFVSKKFLKQ